MRDAETIELYEQVQQLVAYEGDWWADYGGVTEPEGLPSLKVWVEEKIEQVEVGSDVYFLLYLIGEMVQVTLLTPRGFEKLEELARNAPVLSYAEAYAAMTVGVMIYAKENAHG